jgi:hypothetical protein
MCTVSVIPLLTTDGSTSGYRVVCNRDESHARPPASKPRWRSIDGSDARALWPMDMEAGGTWIGVSESGLALSILNLNLEPSPDHSGTPDLRSRGLIIPELLRSCDAEHAVRSLAAMDLERFAPFRLLAVSGREPRSAELRWDRTELTVSWQEGPLCLASSGLGDSRVLKRLDLFEDLVVRPGVSAERQDEYHRHSWAERPEISVLMCRDEARTVSITTVEVVEGHLPTMAYEPVAAASPVLPGRR